MKAPAEKAQLCSVYRSARQVELYLYVRRQDGLSRVPAALLQSFGTATEVLTFALHAERPLARARASEVLQALQDQGFYLQVPPELGPLRFTQGGS